MLMVFSACVDYVAADQIYKSGKTPERKMWLLISLITNLGLLFVFKYTYFIYDGIQIFGSTGNQNLPDLGIRIILPLGISFYTFQTISYTIDTYRKVIKPEKNFLAFLTYVTFWPQLIAGPILRAKEVIPQLVAERKANIRDIIPGVERIIVGLFKKVVLADTIAVMVDSAFDLDPNLFSAYDVWAAAILFGFQIYFDFSGYSDIAIGSARILGIRFPENFNFPYLSLSPKDFWKRWHISLSSWVRDYLYLPLIGQPVRTESTGGLAVAAEQDGNNKRTLALFLAWFIMGLWHGAAWTFGIWGLYHALLLFVYRKFRILNVLIEKTPVLAWSLMFALATVGWIPFRAQSLSQAGIMFLKIINPLEYTLSVTFFRAVHPFHVYGIIALMAGMLLTWYFTTSGRVKEQFNGIFPAIKFVRIAVMVFFVLLYLKTTNQFIYFQF